MTKHLLPGAACILSRVRNSKWDKALKRHGFPPLAARWLLSSWRRR